MVVCRGTGSNFLMQEFSLGDLSDDALQSLIGKSYTEKGFLSTCGVNGMGGQGFLNKPVQWTIYVPEGTSGAVISGISSRQNELEILINAGQKLEIVTAYNKDGVVQIVANIIGG